MFQNLCIEHNYPCEPSCRLEVNDLELFEKSLKRNVNINESNLNLTKISNWLWINHW